MLRHLVTASSLGQSHVMLTCSHNFPAGGVTDPSAGPSQHLSLVRHVSLSAREKASSGEWRAFANGKIFGWAYKKGLLSVSGS